MGGCFSGKSKKSSKKQVEEGKISEESYYEIFQVNEKFKSFYEINPISSNLIKKKQILAELSDNEILHMKVNPSFGEADFKRRNYIRARKSSDKPPTDSSAATNGSKFSHEALSPHSPKLLKSFSEGFSLFVKSETDRRKESIESTSSKFQPDEFLYKSYLNSLQDSKELWKLKKPKRLSSYNPRTFLAINGTMQYMEVPQIVEMPSLNEIHELPEDYTINSPDIVSSLKEENLAKRNSLKKGFTKSISSYELEQLDLSHKVETIKLFFVPFIKTMTEQIDYKLKELKINEFDYFYKSPSVIDDDLSASKSLLIKGFPTRWKNCEVPFLIDKSLMFVITPKNDSLYNIIVKGIHEVMKKTVIKFISYSPEKHPDYLFFSLGKENCSYLGRHSGKNPVLLNTKVDMMSVLHQIMHCLGFMHQHQKANKETFVYISPHQLQNSSFLEKYFQVCIVGIENGPYDYSSVLNFKSCENMISYRSDFDGEVLTLSKLDCEKINLFYLFEKIGQAEMAAQKLLEMRKIADVANGDTFRRMSSIRRRIY